MDAHLNEMVQYGFYALISFVSLRGVHQIESLVRSVDNLNKQMATMFEKTEWHEKLIVEKHGHFEKQLDRHDTRLTKLEQLEN